MNDGFEDLREQTRKQANIRNKKAKAKKENATVNESLDYIIAMLESR